jgi:hypothetical protein
MSNPKNKKKNKNSSKMNSSTSVVKAPAKIFESDLEQDFDSLYNEDQKAVDKAAKLYQDRQAKKSQFVAKVNELQMKLNTAKINYRKSLLDPTMDSIELGLTIKVTTEKLKFASELFSKLFPKEYAQLFPSSN